MKKIHFKNLKEFAYEIKKSFNYFKSNLDFTDIAIIAMYNDAKELIKELISLGYDIDSIDIKNSNNGYDNLPYIISITNIDSDNGEVWCEPFKRKDGYITDESTITYVMSNCPSSCLKTIESKIVIEVSIGECDSECFCEHECCIKNQTVHKPVENKKINSTSSYKVNGKEVSREEFEKFKKKVDDDYLDTVRNMLLKHCSIMDEINEMSRLLRW